ncbi:MAG: hypothetical protein ACR2F0_02500 [Chthoniobacterales bacterium]
MTPGATSPAEYAPIFDWTSKRSRKIPLAAFLFGSLLLHALCFYLFQIVYPVTVSLLPPPARVNLITVDTDDGRLLLRWVEAEDPALSSTTQRSPKAEAILPPEPGHVPSYAHHQPVLKQLPPLQPDLRIPSAEPPGPVALPRPAPPAPIGLVKTTLRFGLDDHSLGAPVLPTLQFSAAHREPPEAAQFRIALSPAGDVRYCFLENSSGDTALDAQARHVLLRCRFPSIRNQQSAISNSLRWTTATFQWGNDLALPALAPAEAPAP